MHRFFKPAIVALQALILGTAGLPIAAGAQTAPPGMVKTWNAVSPSIVSLTILTFPAATRCTRWARATRPRATSERAG